MDIPLAIAHELAQLSGVVVAATDLRSALTEVTRLSTAVVPRCDGVSVTLRERGIPVAGAADDAWAVELDTVQVIEQEGPCLDCTREGSVIRVRDLAEDGRFPTYGPRAAGLGARSAVSVPLTNDGLAVGALNFYSRGVDAFDTDDMALMMVLGAHAALALQVAAAYYSSHELAAQLQEALAGRAVIEQAKGILIGQRRCSPDEAFAILARLSQTSNRKLRVVARALVDSALPQPPEATGGWD
jgi:GAF domain-containing protein